MKVNREPGWPEIKVGLIALAAISFFVFVVMQLDSGEGFFSQHYAVHAKLRDLAGLRKGAPVHFSGVDVGSVKTIEFQEDGWVILTLKVSPEVKPFIKTTSKLSIESMGLLGDKFVRVHHGGHEDPLLPAGAFLESAPSGNVADIVEETADVVAKAKQAVEHLDHVLEQVATSQGTLGKLIKSPELHDAVKATFTDLNRSMQSKSTLGKLMHDPRLYNDLQKAAKDLSGALTAFNDKKSNVGSFIHDKQLYNKVNTLVEEITKLATDIRENPKRYFRVSVF